MNIIRPVLELAGAIAVAYYGVRIAATVKDVGQRGIRWLRGDKNAWKTDQELQEEKE